ncbi:MAG TPA: hypothetical protein VIO61_16875 [Anaerolineaceae bacterium]
MTGIYNGLNLNLGNLSRLSRARTCSISAENPTGAKGRGAMSKDGPAFSAARDLGVGWKVSPYINIDGKTTATLAEINEPGAIQQIWRSYVKYCVKSEARWQPWAGLKCSAA